MDTFSFHHITIGELVTVNESFRAFDFSSKMSETLQGGRPAQNWAYLQNWIHFLKSEDIYTESKLSTFPKCWENGGIDFY